MIISSSLTITSVRLTCLWFDTPSLLPFCRLVISWQKWYMSILVEHLQYSRINLITRYFVCRHFLLLLSTTPVTLASGRRPIFPLVAHQPASLSIWPAVQSPAAPVHKSKGDNVVRMWVQLKR